MSVSVLIKNAASTIGEGPHWDPVTKSLFYVDMLAGDVHKYDYMTGKDTKVHFGKCNFYMTQLETKVLV